MIGTAYDAVIIGAGPAGASAARRCAQLGLSTLVVDRAEFPREKLCGGAVSARATSCCDSEVHEELVERNVCGGVCRAR